MKERLKTLKPYITNVLLVVSIFLLTLMICDVSPFGDTILGKSDAVAQYKPMLYNYIMNIKNGTFELYSFNNGLGNPFIFNFTYYLISPVNFIGLLFNNGDVMYLAVIIVKIAIAAITTTYYTKKHGCSNIASTIAAISYVFSSWFLAYYYNIMWLDLFMIFPLFQYYLENLTKNKKIFGFIFTLAYLYVTNFYQAFAILIYSLVYFLVRNFFYEERTIKEKIIELIRFIFAAILTILLMLVYLYILVQVKRQTGLGYSDITAAGYVVTSMDFLKALFYGTTNITTEFSGFTYPNIALNSLILINIVYFFINKNIKTKDKIFALIGMNLVLACIFYKRFDYIMNMFHNVVGLTYRYSFIFVFLGLTLFVKNAENYEPKQDKRCIPIILVLIALLTLNIKNMEFNVYIFNLVFLLSYLILVLFYNNSTIYKKLIVLLVIIQSLIACIDSIPDDIKKENLTYDYFQTEPTKYRLNTLGENDFLNKNMYSNQDSTYLFTSMLYNPSSALLNKFGCPSGGNSITCYNNNKVFNMIFNVKNDYYLEKIYSVNKDILTLELNKENSKIATEEFIKTTTGVENLFKEETLKSEIKNNKSYFKTDYDFYFIDNTYNGETITTAQELKEFYTDNTELTETKIYTYNEDKIKEAYEVLNKNQIKYTSYKDSHIEGTINVDENQVIFTTIPYDETWIIKIDGKKTKPTQVLDALIAIEVKPGTHKISIEYIPNYKKPAIISGITFLGLITALIISKRKEKRMN